MDVEEEILADPDEPSDYLLRGSEFFMKYGWFIFGGFVLIGFFWNRIQRYLDKLYEQYESRKYAAKYHKNPDLALERLEQLQRARQKMQEELDRKAKEFEEKQKEREKEKTLEKIAKAGGKESGRPLGYESSSENKSRPEYNPLMGDSSSRGYRPPRRSGCPGGGCG